MSDNVNSFCCLCECLDTYCILLIMCTIYSVCTDYFLVHAKSVNSNISMQDYICYLVAK